MSYNISLYNIETKKKEQNSIDENFFEKEENIAAFTLHQIQELKERLLLYEYELTKEDDTGLHFSNPNENFGLVLLTNKVLSFTPSWNENSIFEVGMTASEFTDTGEYAKYDFQNGNWEIWE